MHCPVQEAQSNMTTLGQGVGHSPLNDCDHGTTVSKVQALMGA